jgi:hypothetical protein
MRAQEPGHPDQPLVIVDGTVRFKANRIVRFLLDQASAGIRCDLNNIATHAGLFPLEDLEQFYQLIGYSVGGYGEISAFDRDKARRFAQAAAELRERTEEEGAGHSAIPEGR